jgi:hypothetical protein
MTGGYEDIRELAARAGVTPQWWDEHGTPRFAEHHPVHCPNIYAEEVVLLLIACQLCGHEMPVQMSVSSMDQVRASMMDVKFTSLADRVRSGVIHYGDPPWHDEGGEFCHAGCTMNCDDLRVLEFWRRKNYEWSRVDELEIELPK